MATTNILLREDIEHLGGRGEIVKVKAGYARNYLLPKKMALLATKGNVKQVEQEREQLLKKSAEERSTAEMQAGQMENVRLEFKRLAGETGTLFGSVTSMDVTTALNEKGYEIDRRQIDLKEPIKELGNFTVNVKLHREVNVEIPVTVSAEGEQIVDEKSKKKTADGKKSTETEEIATTESE